MFTKDVRGLTFTYPNEREFRMLYEEIFKKHVYYHELDGVIAPKILDIGAHVGLASLYFKQLFPTARITAFEPEPTLFECLVKNVEQNKIQDTQLIDKAVWSSDMEIQLHVDDEEENNWLSTSSLLSGAWTRKQKTAPITVQAISLKPYLGETVDIMKMDVEGAETEIIKDIREYLPNIRHMFIEFHANRTHRPEQLVTLLLNANFELTVIENYKEITVNEMTRRKPTLYLIEAKNRKFE